MNTKNFGEVYENVINNPVIYSKEYLSSFLSDEDLIYTGENFSARQEVSNHVSNFEIYDISVPNILELAKSIKQFGIEIMFYEQGNPSRDVLVDACENITLNIVKRLPSSKYFKEIATDQEIQIFYDDIIEQIDVSIQALNKYAFYASGEYITQLGFTLESLACEFANIQSIYEVSNVTGNIIMDLQQLLHK